MSLCTTRPTGRGSYAWANAHFRDDGAYLSRFDFVAIEYTHARSSELAARLKDAGVPVYGFSEPDNWEPSRWRSTLPQIERWCDDNGAAGYFADPEDVWRDTPDARAHELGAALGESAGSFYVNLTSFPLMPRRAAFAAGAAGRIEGSPQLYPQAGTPSQWRSWYADWKRLFGSLVPSLSLDRATAGAYADQAAYDTYLRALPSSRAVIAWGDGSTEPWRDRSYLTKTRIDPLAKLAPLVSCYLPVLLIALVVVVAGALLWRQVA